MPLPLALAMCCPLELHCQHTDVVLWPRTGLALHVQVVARGDLQGDRDASGVRTGGSRMRVEKAVTAEQNIGWNHFDTSKAVAAIAYLAQRTGESMYPVLKMLYLADKRHLERYGRFIVGDSYVAMHQGPVPSSTYDMLKFVRGDRKFFDGGDIAARAFSLDKHTHRLELLADPDVSALSESDIECLAEVAALCQEHGAAFVRNASHDDAWRATGRNGFMAIEAIAAQFEDGPALVQHMANRHPG